MGVGNWPAGVGGAGNDSPAFVSPPVTATLPSAIEFSPQLRGYVQNADGSMPSIHPVDQRVDMLIFVERNSSPSVPDIGTALRVRLARADPAKVQSIAQDEIASALKPLVDAGDIVILNVVTQYAPGNVQVAFSYRNMRLSPLSPPRTLRL